MNHMKLYYKLLFAASLAALATTACDTDVEPEVVQEPTVYSEAYYQNLRDYKKSDHSICFGWYAGYTSEASASQGLHFMGLPDSMDIISLWSSIPSSNALYTETSAYNERYLPKALEEMNYIRRVKGTRVVMCTICRIASTSYPKTDAGIEAYAMHLVKCVLRNDLDGLDLDYEPEGDWLQNDNFTKFVEVLGNYFGPKSGSDKLLIVDFYSQTPPAATEPYVDYFVRQCYSCGSAQALQTSFNGISSWCPPEKFVATEQMGWYWQNGGVAFKEEDGNNVDSWGNPLYSVIGMARWNPTQGRKGGFGGYYFEYEYNTTRPANQAIGDKEQTAVPYYSLRRGIQEQNPAGKPVAPATQQTSDEN
jgi:hypothetical protein